MNISIKWNLTTALRSTLDRIWSILPSLTLGNMEESAPLQNRNISPKRDSIRNSKWPNIYFFKKAAKLLSLQKDFFQLFNNIGTHAGTQSPFLQRKAHRW